MTLIELRSIEKFYGGRPLLRGLGMNVGPGARIGLVGGNDAGKSTLLRILAGSEVVDGGEVTWRRGLRTAYLPQHVVGDERTPPEVVRAGRPEIAELKGDLDACETQLGAPEVSFLRRMQRAPERHGQSSWAASSDGRRSVSVSVNTQLTPEAGAPGVFKALRRAEALAVCAALAEDKPSKDKVAGKKNTKATQ
jgi:ATPase subunit of ABC transporter with duplicated ATPase domains